MPIAIVLNSKGATRHVVLCDHCNERITDVAQAMTAWDHPEPGAASPVKFYHGGCVFEVDAQTGGRMGTADMDTAIVEIAPEVGWCKRVALAAKRKANWMAEFMRGL